jgi:integrase
MWVETVDQLNGQPLPCQELMAHKDMSTTMIYTHVLNKGGIHIKSPLDD